MGMAASQARFLSLTARKSNTEYQGQQVNQARTILAQESSNIVAQMAALNVPTPPIQTDYSKMAYTFADANNNGVTITDWNPNPNYDENDINSYKYLADIEYQVPVKKATPIAAHFSSRNGSSLTLNGITGSDYNISDAGDNESTAAALKALDPDGKKGYDYTNLYYLESTTANANGKKEAYYVLKSQLDNPAIQTGDDLDLYSVATMFENRTARAEANFSDSTTGGRKSSVTFGKLSQLEGQNWRELTDDEDVTNLSGYHASLSVTRISDDEGYDSAWNQYLYDKDVYEKKIAELNAKTDEIQAQDKTLELQLKQLDTEQEALTQEMEAVKAVIQKNVEKTFNTFA